MKVKVRGQSLHLHDKIWGNYIKQSWKDIKKEKTTVMSSIDQQNNGNPHTHETRNSFNQKVAKLSMLGRSKKVQWSDKRRYRNI